MYVGIICACLPCLKAFAKYHFPRVFDIKPVWPARERLDMSSRIPARLRALTKSTRASRETGMIDEENVLPLQSKTSNRVSSSTPTGHGDGVSEERPPGTEDDRKSKSSVTDTYAMDRTSTV